MSLPDRIDRFGYHVCSRCLSFLNRVGFDSTSSRLRLVAARTTFALAMVVLIAAVGLFAFRTLYADKRSLDFSLAGVQVGGLTSEQAGAKLQSQADAILASTLTLTFGNHMEPTLGELGVSVYLPAA